MPEKELLSGELDIFSSSDLAAVGKKLRELNPADIAELFEEYYDSEGDDDSALIRVFRLLPKDSATDVFSYLPGDVQEHIISKIKDHEIRSIVDDLWLDDAVDFIEEMPANVVTRVLSNLPREKRELINQFLKYPENSAGSVMTNEYIDLKSHLTVAETFEKIRREGPDKETIYTCYVIDSSRKLIGTVSVKTLLLSQPTVVIGDIMERNPVFAVTTDDEEVLVEMFKKYGLLALPVVDNEERLVGIVTVDDAITIQEEEATEDFEKMAALAPSEDPYLKTSVFRLARNRIVWLLVLMLSATITGSILAGFEDALSTMIILTTFIPMLMDTGGNAGAQSSTLIIRGIAVGDIEIRDVLRVLWKEFRVAVLCGLILSIVNFCRIMLMNGGDLMLSVTISLTLFGVVIMAKVVGSMLPIAAKKMRLDPAVMASPLLTTIVDAGSLWLFFTVAKILLGV